LQKGEVVFMKRAMVVAVLLLACAVLAEDVGTITIYRLSDHRRGWKPAAFCDNQQIAEMQGGKYVTLNVSAGKHTFTSSKEKNRVEVDVKPGEQYFIRINEPGELELVPGVQGRQQIVLMSPLEPAKVHPGVCGAGAAQ
jgi:Protein of unknown function (DUF2846)